MAKRVTAKLKKKLITGRQKAARKINIEIARRHRKKKTRFGNPIAGKKKKISVAVEKRISAKEKIENLVRILK